MTKVISLSDDAYELLSNLKEGNESFSEVVRRITKDAKKKSIYDNAGMWVGDKKELDEIEKDIYESRKKFKLRDY